MGHVIEMWLIGSVLPFIAALDGQRPGGHATPAAQQQIRGTAAAATAAAAGTAVIAAVAAAGAAVIAAVRDSNRGTSQVVQSTEGARE